MCECIPQHFKGKIDTILYVNLTDCKKYELHSTPNRPACTSNEDLIFVRQAHT